MADPATIAHPTSISLRTEATLAYSDNAPLAPPGSEKSDFILGVRVPLGLHSEGSRVRYDVQYAPIYYYYLRDTTPNEWQNYLRAAANAEVVDNLFFVDASANIDQTYISPFQPRPETGTGANNNRTQETVLRLSPTLESKNARGWQYSLRNDSYWSTYDGSGLDNSFVDRIHANLRTPAARIRTDFDYEYLYTKFESSPTSNYQQVARVRPLAALTPRLSVGPRVGYETNNYDDKHSSNTVYGGEFDWSPTPRTRAAGFVEHRFFGTSYKLDISQRMRQALFRLAGVKGTFTGVDQGSTLRPSTTAELLDDAYRSRYPDPEQRQEAVDQFMAGAGLQPVVPQIYSFYSSQVYVSEQVGASIALIGTRTTIETGLFWQKNDAVTGSGTPASGVDASNRFRQQGGRVVVSRRLTEVTSTTLGYSRLRSTQLQDSAVPNNATFTEDAVKFTVVRKLSTHTDASIGARWANYDSDTNPYRETAVVVGLAHSF